MHQLSEFEIIEKAISGDTRAFRLLVEKHQSFAYSLSFRLLGNSEDAEDIVQEAFIRIWKHLKNYRRENKLTTWLYKIITNLCLDLLKSKHYKNKTHRKDLDRSHFLPDPTNPEREVQKKELTIIILRLAEGLTPKQKAVFVLRDLEGLEITEINNILNMSSGNIKSNLYYARLKISERLKNYYGSNSEKKERLYEL